MSVPVIRRSVTSTSAQLSWSKVAAAPSVEKVPITYPIFYTIATACSDHQWLKILENFYHGKFFPKFTCVINVLKYRKDKKTFSCVLDENDPSNAFITFRNFVGKHTGIVSDLELEQYEREGEIESENMAKKTWAGHTQVMKNCMLEMFFARSAKVAGLNAEEKQQLKSLVHFGLFFGYFKDQIIVENNQICYIAGLHFDEVNRKFFLDPSLKPRPVSSNKKKVVKPKTTVHFDKIWSKVCEHYPHHLE